jgi:hypothetical protein
MSKRKFSIIEAESSPNLPVRDTLETIYRTQLLQKEYVKTGVRNSQIDQSVWYSDQSDFLQIKVFLGLNSPKLIIFFLCQT